MGRKECRQPFILDDNRITSGDGGVFVHRGHCGHAVAHVADFVYPEDIFVGGPGDDAVGNFQVLTGHDPVDAGHGQGCAGVNADNAGVGMGAALDFAVEHARQLEVVGVAQDAAHAFGGVDFAMRLAEDPMVTIGLDPAIAFFAKITHESVLQVQA